MTSSDAELDGIDWSARIRVGASINQTGVSRAVVGLVFRVMAWFLRIRF